VISFRNLAIAMALGLIAVFAAPVAAWAATPGSACTLILSGENSEEEVPGTVSSNGKSCVPNEVFFGTLAALNVGVACGTHLELADIFISSDCPH
jgi:hypothetical protein